MTCDSKTDRRFDPLLLSNQLCFPLYAASKEVVRRYTPMLKNLDLTYTQYIAMMVMWEEETITVKELGERLCLESGTLTPLLKKMEAKGLIERERSDKDERKVVVTITQEGRDLRATAMNVPPEMGRCVGLDTEDAVQLHKLLEKVIENVRASE